MSSDVSAITIKPLTPHLGVEIEGVNISKDMSDDVFKFLYQAYLDHSVLVFRNQSFDHEDYVAFGRRFGELAVHHLVEHTLPDYPAIRVLSNVKEGGRLIGADRAGLYWHSDLSYEKAPAKATMLYGIECPPVGGDTLYTNMYAAYDALSEDMKARLQGLRAVHDRHFRYHEMYPERPRLTQEQLAAVPPVDHPIVRTHPETGRKALFVYETSVSKILNMDDSEARDLLVELERFCTQPNFVYRHKWKAGDLALSDERCSMHCATGYDNKYRRILHRLQVRGEVPN